MLGRPDVEKALWLAGYRRPKTSAPSKAVVEENLEHARKIYQKRIEKNKALYPAIYEKVQTDAFREKYLEYMGEPWQLFYETTAQTCFERIRHLAWRVNEYRIETTRAPWKKLSDIYKLPPGRRREAIKKLATPSWSDQRAIQAVYRKRDDMNFEAGMGVWSVDHIYPLLSEHVCGLHVAENLQIITAKKNMQKQNKIIDEGI